MTETHEQLGWCNDCGQPRWYELKTESFDPDDFDMEGLAEQLSIATLKQRVGEPLTESEKVLIAFRLNASSCSMGSKFGTLVPEEEDDES